MLAEFKDRSAFDAVRRKLALVAWCRYRIASGDAEDIAQTAITAYFEVRDRYSGEENQFGIFLGIFCKKCLVFLSREGQEARGLRRLRLKPELLRIRSWPNLQGSGSTVLDQLIVREDARAIRTTLDELPERTRRMLRALLDRGRQGLIEQSGLNENTLDSRLHSARSDLRKRLRSKGLSA